ncbi:MAG: DUF167 family protein [Alphaproteobacteria bacterium]|nr:DUF167 family protein [Alphaproteobacteria bacterium]
MNQGDGPWRQLDEGLSLRVRVTPKSSKDIVLGLCETADGPAVQTKVRAVPEDGAANSAVEKLIACWLDVPKSAVTLRSGAKSRVKLLHVQGAPATLVETIRRKL